MTHNQEPVDISEEDIRKLYKRECFTCEEMEAIIGEMAEFALSLRTSLTAAEAERTKWSLRAVEEQERAQAAEAKAESAERLLRMIRTVGYFQKEISAFLKEV